MTHLRELARMTRVSRRFLRETAERAEKGPRITQSDANCTAVKRWKVKRWNECSEDANVGKRLPDRAGGIVDGEFGSEIGAASIGGLQVDCHRGIGGGAAKVLDKAGNGALAVFV